MFHPTPRGAVQISDEKLNQVLLKTFGHREFRPIQRDVIQRILKGHDCLLVLPTGGGKSLCYQLPAILLRGVALVVSPLVALMQDQVQSLKACGIAAEALSSLNSQQENAAIIEGLEEAVPAFKILFITPERLTSKGFEDTLMCLYDGRMISLLAVDEAHCISSWGHDFRPAYRGLHAIRDKLRGVPCLAATATATAPVRFDILEQLGMGGAKTFMDSFNRPNIHYKIIYKDIVDNALDTLLSRMDRFGKQTCGIIYCQKREVCEYLSGALLYKGFSARPYHAGLPEKERTKNQQAWISGKIFIICATIAFGMGIDKGNVRFVIHWNMPKSMEGFYQESGRAGRDGRLSDSIIFYSKTDFDKFKFVISKTAQERAKKKKSSEAYAALMLGALSKVKQFCETACCRRLAILEYFGEQVHYGICMRTCDFCQNETEVRDNILKMQSSSILRPISSKKGMGAIPGDDGNYEYYYDQVEEDSESEESKEEQQENEAKQLLEDCHGCSENIPDETLMDRLDALEQLESRCSNDTAEERAELFQKRQQQKRHLNFSHHERPTKKPALQFSQSGDTSKNALNNCEHKENLQSPSDLSRQTQQTCDSFQERKERRKNILKEQSKLFISKGPSKPPKKVNFTDCNSSASNPATIEPPPPLKEDITVKNDTLSVNHRVQESIVRAAAEKSTEETAPSTNIRQDKEQVEALEKDKTEISQLGLTNERRTRLIQQLFGKLVEINGATFKHEKLKRLAQKMELECFTAAVTKAEYKTMMTGKLQKACTKLKVPPAKQSAANGNQLHQHDGIMTAIREEETIDAKLGLTVERRRRFIEQIVQKLTEGKQNTNRNSAIEAARQMEYECFSQSTRKAVYKVMMTSKLRDAVKRVC